MFGCVCQRKVHEFIRALFSRPVPSSSLSTCHVACLPSGRLASSSDFLPSSLISLNLALLSYVTTPLLAYTPHVVAAEQFHIHPCTRPRCQTSHHHLSTRAPTCVHASPSPLQARPAHASTQPPVFVSAESLRISVRPLSTSPTSSCPSAPLVH